MGKGAGGFSPRSKSFVTGSRMHHNLPAPTAVTTPRASCMADARVRVRLAIRQLVCEERQFVEGVVVELTPAFSKCEYFVQKAKDDDDKLIRYTLDEAVEAVCLIMKARERKYMK